jgi:hypothetical protein
MSGSIWKRLYDTGKLTMRFYYMKDIEDYFKKNIFLKQRRTASGATEIVVNHHFTRENLQIFWKSEKCKIVDFQNSDDVSSVKNTYT